jgi:xylan 1,4-beta-xylosidase
MTQLHLDLNHRTAIDPVWTFGGSVGRASLLLRPDVRRQVQICRDELGLRHLRLTGLLSEEMAPPRGDGSLDFTKVEAVIDALMEDGYLPFISLSAEQSAPERWYESVKALATLIDGRYGCDAREWHFEIRRATGEASAGAGEAPGETPRPYDLAARAIKEVHPEFRVGLSFTGDRAAAEALLRDAAQSTPTNDYWLDARRCDFITTDAAGLSSAREVPLIRRWLTDVIGTNLPLICAAWGGGFEAAKIEAPPNFDLCSAAAATCQAAAEIAPHVQGMIFDAISDIRDPSARCAEPFHGGPGLLTVNDIRKASFNALRFFGDHRGYHCQSVGASWTDPIPGLGCIASVEEYTLRLLCWFHRESDDAPANGPARFSLEGLPQSVHMAQAEVIRPGAGSPFETWVEHRRPPFVNRTILDALELAAHPAMADVDFREYPPRLEPGMVMQLTIPLPFEEHWTD